MKNRYGLNLAEYSDKSKKCAGLAASYLNNEQLGLLLGAGASMGLGLPNWIELIGKCARGKITGIDVESIQAHELKDIAQKIKDSCRDNNEYLDLVTKSLFMGVEFNFNLAKKELLIALTALLVGKSRGNVRNIVTYNFDSVIEWYLKINGLSVNVVNKNHLLSIPSDVDILHIHGYLPHDDQHGDRSDQIVFSKEEFEDRMAMKSYYKHMLLEFLKKNVSLSIGMSALSIINDLVPYLRVLDSEFYDSEGISRDHPYLIAFLTDCTDDQRNKLLSSGVVPCVIHPGDIPESIFTIAQIAASTVRLY